MTTLARWRASQVGGLKEKERRPYLASDCDDLHQAEKWRRQILGEISRKVAQIQNAGLGEFKLRDLNDEINKLLREKGHWEDRILELGGPDYKKTGPKMLDADGKEVPGNKGYKYFGAAKDLPGVRELFQQEPPAASRKTRAELMKDIDADYYGYRDEDDGRIIPAEQEVEKTVIAKKVAEWKERVAKIAKGEISQDIDMDAEEEIYHPEEMDLEETIETKSEETEKEHFIAHVPVPSQQEIEAAIVRRKKMELIQRYATDTLLEEEDSIRKMLGV